MGLVTGMNAAAFAPKSDTTREQAAAVLLRAYQGLKTKVGVTAVSAAPAGAVFLFSSNFKLTYWIINFSNKFFVTCNL